MKKNKLKKSIAVLLAAAITFSNFSGIGSLKEVKAASTVTIENSSFETTTKDSSGKLTANGWSTINSAEVVSTGAQSGSKCLKITNNSSTVNEVTQTLELEESTEYVLTGYIKGENISGVDADGKNFGDGATIDFDENTAYMVDHTNNWMKGTFGWKQVKVYFVTPSNPAGSTVQVKLRCRLGHGWGNASGTAYFDNISIQKQAYPSTGTDRVKLEKANVAAYIKKENVDAMGYTAYSNWLDDIQKAYICYKDLTGSVPYNGDKLIFIDTDEPMIQQFGAIGNFNPILLNGSQKNNFLDYAKNGYMNFGFLHEMGHSFDKKNNNTGDYNWNFNAEFWANTKMLYVFDHTDDIVVNMSGVISHDSKDIAKYYKEVAGNGYDNKIAKGVFDGDSYDSLTYVFIKLIEKLGWEPFEATFREYVKGNISEQGTTYKSFEKFLEVLQKKCNPNGTEVMDCIGERDFNIIKNGMQGGISTAYDKYISYSSVIPGNSNFEEYVYAGEISGTEGQSKKIKKMSIKTPEISGVLFRGYINGKWTDWKTGGSIIDGNGYSIEAIQVKLTGNLANKCDVYYRTHNYAYGWLGWTGNGATAGTRNMDSGIEGYQIQLVAKGSTVDGITNDTTEASKEKYKVVFKDGNTVLKEELVEYGGSATAPKNTAKTGYTFIGWSGSYTNVKDDVEITANYDRDIKITSVDINGGADVIAGKKAYIKINTNCTDNLVYSVDIHSIAGNMQLANKVSSNVIEWTPTENYAGTYCTIEIAVRDSSLVGASAIYTAGCSVKQKTENITTIYYKGYENPNIHYQIGNGDWTKVPGVKMEANSEVEGYNYAVTINLGDADSLTACFNDGNNNWDSKGGENYTFGAGYYTYSNQKITKISKPKKELEITNLTASPENSIVEGQQVIFKTETKDAQGTLKYKYTATSANGTTQVLRDYSTYNDLSWLPGAVGKYKITVYVTDGVTTQEKSINYEVTEFKNVSVSKLESSLGTEFVLGKTTTISLSAKDGYSSSYSYSVKVNGTEILPNASTTSVKWTPSQTGSYTVAATVTDARGVKSQKSMTINVVEGNTTTIYYKGYTNPNIHYQIGNGSWTKAPGVKLEANSEVDGYNYAITIDLGDATSLTACFNDGNNNWDSNDSKNYSFGTGYYTYSNKQVTKIAKPEKGLKITNLTASPEGSIVEGQQVIFKTVTENAQGTLKYKYTATSSNGTTQVLRDYSTYNDLAWLPGSTGKYKITVYVTDGVSTKEKSIDYEVTEFKNVNVSKLESSLGTEFVVGNTTNISVAAKDGHSSAYYYSIKVNGTEILPNTSSTTASWTPSQTGTYTVVATVTDARGTKAEKTMTINVVESNSTTIYYNGYANPNIHYKIGNGAWTNAPGVKMEANSDVDGYNYAITIDLGAATSLTACFNDGNNNWDSNDSKNYVFGAGYYTYSNNKITKIEKPSAELKIKSITSSCGDTMNYSSSSDITINAAGGQGPYTYTMYYSLYGSGRACYLLNNSKTNTATFTPDYPRKTTLFVTVTDAAGTTVTAQKVIDVKEVSQNQVTIYYKGYNNPNIHYRIGNGDWTNVPGVQMGTSSKVSGYPYAITIDLGDATSLTACFNDGNGNWDSNNSNNYTFGVGEYTYSNGSITKMN